MVTKLITPFRRTLAQKNYTTAAIFFAHHPILSSISMILIIFHEA